MRNGLETPGRKFAIAGAGAAVAATIATFLVVWASQPTSHEPREWTTRGVVMVSLVFVVPVLLAVAGSVTTGTTAQVTRWASAALFLLAVSFFGLAFALYLVPAVLLAVAAVVAQRQTAGAQPSNDGSATL